MVAKKQLPRDEKEKRDGLILHFFLIGWTEREIAKATWCNLHYSQVHRIIVKQLEIAGQRFGLISEKSLIVYSERLELLIKAIFPGAIQNKDPKSIEVARRLLDQQAKLYQISDEKFGMPLAPMGDNELADEVADLQEYRARHRRPPEAL